MRINEDFIEDIESSDLTSQEPDIENGQFATEDECDIKLIFAFEGAFGRLSWPSYKRFFRKLCRYLEMSNRISKHTQPKIKSVSVWAKESEGGPIPDDFIEIIRTGDSKEYVGKAGLWTEFCIVSNMRNIRQSYGFMSDIVKMSRYIQSDGKPKYMASGCYIHPKLTGDVKEFKELYCYVSSRDANFNAEHPQAFFTDAIEPAMILCNHNPHAFDNIMEDTKMNIFPKANREYNEGILRLNSHARTIKDKSFNVIKNVSKTSFNPERLFENNVHIRIVNEAFRQQQTVTALGNHVYEYGSRIPWEKELIDKILLTTGVRDIRFNEIQDMDSIQAFIWVGTYCIDDSFAVGLNTYNVYASIVKKNEQKDAFMKQLEEMFPGSDKGIINENYIEELTDDDIIRDETVTAESSRDLNSYEFTVCIDNIHIPERSMETCRQRLNKKLEKCPFIYDFVVKYEDEIDSRDFNCYNVNIFMDDDMRRTAEVYKLMHMLVSIYDPKCFNDTTIYFMSYDKEVSISTFSVIVNYRARGKKITVEYFYDFMGMCRLALDKHFDVNKCAQFIGFDFAGYIMDEITSHLAPEVTNTLQEIDADFILNVDDMLSEFPQQINLSEFPQQINLTFCRYYVKRVTMFNGAYSDLDATKIDTEIKSRFGNEIHITKAYKMRVPHNGLNSYFLYLGCLSPDDISTAVYMLRANFDSEYDSQKFKHDVIGNDDKLNEDYIENIKEINTADDELTIRDEILTAVNHLLDGTYDSKWDINLQMFESIYKPSGKIELKQLIDGAINQLGNKCSLNWIDVSEMTDLSGTFYYKDFFGDISKWDVSSCMNMSGMFQGSGFSGDISKWNVKNVHIMADMFSDSQFNGDISNWDVHNVVDMSSMFYNACNFNKNISNWKVNKCMNFDFMFAGAHCFSQDLSKWKISKKANANDFEYETSLTNEQLPDILKDKN